MAEDKQNEGNENLEEENVTEETENQDENSADESSTSDDELVSRLNAFEARLERSQMENESLRESLRLQQQYLDKQNSGKGKAELSPELAELGKAINPLLSEHIQESLGPVVGTVSKMYDQTDAVTFQLELQREDPELLKGESFDKISQIVESVRQRAAREQGSWVSRKDAYLYAKGAGMLKKVEQKKAKPASTEESKRKKAVAAAQTAGAGSETRRSTGVPAEIQRIKEKAHRGERLTAEERSKFRSHLEASDATL